MKKFLGIILSFSLIMINTLPIKAETVTFEADIPSWFEVKIPSTQTITNDINKIPISVVGDLKYGENLAIISDDICEMTSTGGDLYNADIVMNKSYYSQDDLNDGCLTSLDIESRELKTGSWSGNLSIYVNITDQVEIKQKTCDIQVIPDKYNTGYTDNGNMTIISEEGGIYDGFHFKLGGDATQLYLNLSTANNKQYDGVDTVFENMDFTLFDKFIVQKSETWENLTTITFKNCVFKNMTTDIDQENVYFVFEDCTFENFYGSNATFYNCAFGGSISDGMNPFKNVSVYNCYFRDFSHNSDKGAHTDGIQIYGKAGTDVTNIHVENCRFEMPVLNVDSTSAINAPLMLQLEFSNGDDITFENIYENGGTYSLYARGVKEQVLYDAMFKDIFIGSKSDGIVYPDYSENVDFYNLKNTELVYVSSVWKDNEGKLHIITTNDTPFTRTLIVVTENNTYEYEIEPIPDVDEMEENITFSDLPIDNEIIIDDNSNYLICYDGYQSEDTQVRFVSFDSQVIYRAAYTEKKDDGAILDSGSAGDNITYTFYESGKLVFEGTGEMENYNSSKPAPWDDYMKKITEVVIGEGVTSIGMTAFKSAYYLTKVTLPEGLTKINTNAFMSCRGIKELIFPSTLEVIENRALQITNFPVIYYNGTREEYEQITLGSYLVETTLPDQVIYLK